MNVMIRNALTGVAAAAAGCLFAGTAVAAETQDAKLQALEKSIETRTPETRVDKPDHESLSVRRINVVDANGVIRMTLAAPTPAPIIDGIQYKRAFPVSGVTMFDADGNERGGFGVADIEGVGTATVLAQDHANVDAIGWRVMPDGAVSFLMNAQPEQVREPRLDNRLLPANAVTRIRMDVAADGTPAIALADKQDRPRLRLTVTDAGYGAIEFLDAAGKVVQVFAPEMQATTGK